MPRWDELRRKDRIRLGIVSRIARVKQFPKLFRLLHDSLTDASDMVEIHIFGSGPWSQVQELKSSLPSSIRPRVFFWGWQEDPWAYLPKIHALLLGMPEKEALGLNILEATMRKIPVIGIEGGPFPEVIESGRNGWLLSKDNINVDFCRVIYELEEGHSKCSFEMTKDYNYRFSEERFEEIMLDLLHA